jgi:2-phospho-L-lactate guanylyltransferase
MRAAVVVPVKAFARAKARLAPALDEAARADLARRMADRVLDAAGSLPVLVACDDDEVAAWARDRGAEVVWTRDVDLNGAVTAAVDVLAARGVTRATVAHADLPHARDLSLVVGVRGVVAVPDRRDDGTNVLTVPTSIGFPFSYGPGSFARHRATAEAMGVPFTVVRPPDLTWDVDDPADLDGVGLALPCE